MFLLRLIDFFVRLGVAVLLGTAFVLILVVLSIVSK